MQISSVISSGILPIKKKPRLW